jgi:HD-GYP domain-containing protein (c-di-GMP phosphodiesterase class II)
VALIVCLRRSPADPYTGMDQVTGEALAPLLISALQTGHRCFDLTEDHQALATLGGALTASIRGGGGRVAAMSRDAERLAQRFQLGAWERAAVRLASILRDIGTVDLAEDLMHREGRLSEAELAQVREHPSFGAAIVQQLPGLDAVVPLVLAHHERWDGAGYPRGLAAGTVPLGARIIAVVDTFHAMTNPRTSRRPHTAESAMAELRACAGTQFDARVVDEFIRMITADAVDA